ncbi:MAG TPA: tol-pal system protein YbgF [Gemmatimonadaceae bacterium]
MSATGSVTASSVPRLRARAFGVVAALALVASGCATRSDVRILQNDIRVMRMESLQADSARRAQIDAVIAALGHVNDSLRLMHAQVAKFQGDMRGELYSLGQQIIQVQELTGQSQRRLQELRGSLEERAQQMQAQPQLPATPSAPAQNPPAGTPNVSAPPTASAPGGSQAATGTAPAASTTAAAPAGPGPNQLFQLALDQLRRGSAVAARAGFQDLLRQYPGADVAPEAQFYIAQSYESEGSVAQADSAYALVVSRYPQSSRAPSALYKRALALQAQGKVQGARAALDQVIREYPRSDEAVLARDRLRTLK